MARFITVHVGCDWDGCTVVSEETNGTVVEKTVSIDGKQPKAFLLCKEHLDEFEAVVEPLLLKGVKVEQPTKRQRSAAASSTRSAETSVTSAVASSSSASAVEDCRICDRPMKGNIGLGQHVIKTHGYANLAAYRAEYPVESAAEHGA